ncbi:MAG: hypothetical protein Q9226_006426 [Calogaya cf. arnoldii]
MTGQKKADNSLRDRDTKAAAGLLSLKERTQVHRTYNKGTKFIASAHTMGNPVFPKSLSPWTMLKIHKVATEDEDRIADMICETCRVDKSSFERPLWRLTKPYKAPDNYFHSMGLSKYVVSIYHEGVYRPATCYITMDELTKAILAQHKKNQTQLAVSKRKSSDSTRAEDTAMEEAGSIGGNTLGGASNKRIRFTEPMTIDTARSVRFLSPPVHPFRAFQPNPYSTPTASQTIEQQTTESGSVPKPLETQKTVLGIRTEPVCKLRYRLTRSGGGYATIHLPCETGDVADREALHMRARLAGLNRPGVVRRADTLSSRFNSFRIYPHPPGAEPVAEEGIEPGKGNDLDLKVWHRPPGPGEVHPTIYRTLRVAAPDEQGLALFAADNTVPPIDEDVRSLQRGSQNREDARREQAKIRAVARHEHAVTACWILQQWQRPKMLWKCDVCDAKGQI